MSIISISHDAFAHGTEIAERVAERLGVECFSREVVLEAAKTYNVDETAIEKALHDAPRLMDRLSSSKERHVAMVRASLLRHLKNGDGVYHGFAGHFFLADVPNVLRIRIVACLEARVREEVRRLRVDEDEARKYLRHEDEERGRWTKHMYGKDYRRPEQYDMCLNLGLMPKDDAVEIILAAAAQPAYTSTLGQARRLKDLAIAAECEARLLGQFTEVKASSIEGKMHVSVRGAMGQEGEIIERVRGECRTIEGSASVCVNVNDKAEL